MKTLETERLILRSWFEDDLDDFFEYAQNPNVGPNAGWPPHTDKQKSLKILKSFIENDDVWAIVHKKSNKVIGSLGLHNDLKRKNDKTRMIGYVLSQEYWGNGLMTEAVKRVLKYCFEEINLELVSVYHYTFNNRSKSVIQKSGFKFEGTLRMATVIYNGNVYDSACYSMTREDYLKKLSF